MRPQSSNHIPSIEGVLAGEMNKRPNAEHIQCPGDADVRAFSLPAHVQRT
jgi:hypothetical protein